MITLLALLVALVLGWLGYRIIRNGFLHSQSEKLNAFGIGVYVVLLLVALYYVLSWAGEIF